MCRRLTNSLYCSNELINVKFLQEWNMGQRASNTSALFFEDVVVPEEVHTLHNQLNKGILYMSLGNWHV